MEIAYRILCYNTRAEEICISSFFYAKDIERLLYISRLIPDVSVINFLCSQKKISNHINYVLISSLNSLKEYLCCYFLLPFKSQPYFKQVTLCHGSFHFQR